MFFSSDMLSKRGPLARVWLAAHVERRLSKTQLLTTSIPDSVRAIVDPTTTTAVPLALRLSGQLLLGVTRIYGRKAKYLLDDCNEALLKIKMAFRTGGGAAAVDMSEEQEAAGREGTNLKDRTGVLDFELMYGGGGAYDAVGWDFDLLNGGYEARAGKVGNAARINADIGDITLPEHDGMALVGGGGADEFNYDLDLDGFGGIDSQDYDMNLDLGLDLGGFDDLPAGGIAAKAEETFKGKKRARSDVGSDLDGDGTFDVEMGRDAPGTADRRSARESLASAGQGMGKDRDLTFDSLGGGGIGSMDLDQPAIFEPENFGDFGARGFDMNMDLGLDIGVGDALVVNATPIPDPIVAQPNGYADIDLDTTLDITPRTTKRIADLPSAKKANTSATKKKAKKQVVDSVTELDASVGERSFGSQSAGMFKESRQDRINKGLLVEPRYLPRSRIELRLMEIRADPVGYYLPKIEKRGDTEWLIAAPPGVCEELRDLFRFPAGASLTAKGKGAGKRGAHDENRPEKRARSGTVESEMGRRREQSAGFNFGADTDLVIGGGMDMGNMGNMGFGDADNFRFDLDYGGMGNDTDGDVHQTADEEDIHLPGVKKAQREELAAEDDLTLEMPELGDSLLSIFDESGPLSQSQAVTGEIQVEGQKTKWSKNTVKALRVLNKELQIAPDEREQEIDEKTMCFKDVSRKASKRAASSFFFELLVLGTRDCIKLDQQTPYGDIEVRSRKRLWEVIGSEGLKGEWPREGVSEVEA